MFGWVSNELGEIAWTLNFFFQGRSLHKLQICSSCNRLSLPSYSNTHKSYFFVKKQSLWGNRASTIFQVEEFYPSWFSAIRTLFCCWSNYIVSCVIYIYPSNKREWFLKNMWLSYRKQSPYFNVTAFWPNTRGVL